MKLPTEADVDRVVPPGTLMRQWVDLGMRQSDGHSLLHVGSYLATLSVLAPLCRLDASHAENNSTLYVLLAGHRGARDGTAVRSAERLIRLIDDRVLGPTPSSPGALRDMLGYSNRATLVVAENLLRLTGNRTKADFEHLLHEIWEGRDIRSWTSRGTHGPRRPRMGMISSIPVRTLREDLLLAHMESGTLRDHLVFLAPGRERQQPSVHGARTRDYEELRQLQIGMQALGEKASDPYAVYTAYFASDQAREMHANWVSAVSTRCEEHSLQSYRARAQRMAERIAMLLSWDFGKARLHCDQNKEFPLGASEIAYAFSIIYHLHLPGVWHLQQLAVRSEDMRIREHILRILREAGSWVPDGELYRQLKITKRDAMPVLETLMAEQALEQMAHPTADGTVIMGYRLRDRPSATAADFEAMARGRGARMATAQPVPIRLGGETKTGQALHVLTGGDGGKTHGS
mgnify:CR=1 FL=1|jgi:hypothetical protein